MRAAVIFCVLVFGCKESNPLYCYYDHPCTLTTRPYCDFIKRECMAEPVLTNPDLLEVDLAYIDMTPPPDLLPPPDLAPPPPHFDDVQADIDALGCASSTCHGGVYPPLLVPNATSQVALNQNWQNLRVDIVGGDMGDPATSLLLTKNLVGSGQMHAGSLKIHPFLDMSNPVYQRWLRWIQEGAVY